MFDAGCIITYAVNMHDAINDDQLLWRATETWVFSKVTCSGRGCRAVRKFVLIRKKKNKKNWGWILFFLDRNKASLWLCGRAKCAAERHLGHGNEQCELAQSSQWQGGCAGPMRAPWETCPLRFDISDLTNMRWPWNSDTLSYFSCGGRHSWQRLRSMEEVRPAGCCNVNFVPPSIRLFVISYCSRAQWADGKRCLLHQKVAVSTQIRA